MIRLASIVLVALWVSGCFITEEIKKGDALIEQHSVGWREKKKNKQQAAQAAAEAEAEVQQNRARNSGPGVKDKLAGWWQETVEEEPETTNPDDKLVSCTIGGSVKFLRQSDCEIRRGRAKPLKSSAGSDPNAPSNVGPGA